MHLDVVFAADPRFPGGTSTATLMDMRAVRRMGLTAGLLPMRSASLRAARAMHPRLKAGMEEIGIVPLGAESRVDCDLVLVEHPSLFPHIPERPTRIRPRAAVLVANHPPRLGGTRPEYDLPAVLDNIERLFAADAHVAPVSPVVRDLILETAVRRDRVTAANLARIVDPAEWEMPIRPPRPGGPVVIGRHARPDPMKWPDTTAEILAAWPARDDIRVHILGGGPPERLVERWPANWRVRPFSTDHPRAFLEEIDFYVYFHAPFYTEAFGLSVLEAMAAGKVLILPDSFRSLFGDAAIYARPADVVPIVERLRDDPEAYRTQAERARRRAVEDFSFATFEREFASIRDALCPGAPAITAPSSAPAEPRFSSPAASASPSPPVFAPPKRRVMFISSNGVGLGHLTRLAAIARKLPAHVEPVFWVLSQGAVILRDLGFPADFVPSLQSRGIDHRSWNRAFAQEFAAALEYHRPDAVVFDGGVPYAGLVEVLDARPRTPGFWIRRALWRPGQASLPMERGRHFEAVIEPLDLAHREDVGSTVPGRHDALRVPPVVLVDPAERRGRAEARRALDLPEDGRVVGLQLGIQGNGELAALRDRLVDTLVRRHGCTVVEIRSPLAPRTPAPPAPVIARADYPLARNLAAFDLLVTEAGYNSFHEAVLSGTPAVFVPREFEGIDDQALRARWADSAGLGFALDRRRLADVPRVLAEALDPDTAAEIRRRAARLPAADGAAEAAGFLAESVAMLRADRPLGAAVDR